MRSQRAVVLVLSRCPCRVVRWWSLPLPDSTVGALDKLSKITLGSGFAEAGKFNDLMLDAVSKCPELATHIGKTLDPNLQQSVTVRFS